ncbi:phosphoribosylaminoimidazole carboxylase ade2, partial [Ascosphaera pollenicola]
MDDTSRSIIRNVKGPGIPAVRNLKERQRDLERMFRRVAQAQRFALTNLASRTEEQLIKDPNAHKRCLEWEMIQSDIDRRFERRIEQLENERDLCVEEENILFEANTRRIEDWAKGEFISKLEELFYGRSNPTEPQEINEDESKAISADIEDIDLVKRTFVRGFNSTTVREPENAQLVDTALYRWDWLSKLIKDPGHFREIMETRLLEIKEEGERELEAETAREKAREDDAAAVQRFDSLAQICSERLETYDRTQKEEKPSDNLAALADVASHEKPDSGKSSEETLIAE